MRGCEFVFQFILRYLRIRIARYVRQHTTKLAHLFPSRR